MCMFGDNFLSSALCWTPWNIVRSPITVGPECQTFRFRFFSTNTDLLDLIFLH